VIDAELDRLRAGADALARLVDLAAHLRRTNAAKWPFSRAEWHATVAAVLDSTELRESDPAELMAAFQATRSLVRRIAHSGDGRFANANVLRTPPDTGQFYEDLDRAVLQLADLRRLAGA
jgi:hypothetical protein